MFRFRAKKSGVEGLLGEQVIDAKARDVAEKGTSRWSRLFGRKPKAEPASDWKKLVLPEGTDPQEGDKDDVRFGDIGLDDEPSPAPAPAPPPKAAQAAAAPKAAARPIFSRAPGSAKGAVVLELGVGGKSAYWRVAQSSIEVLGDPAGASSVRALSFTRSDRLFAVEGGMSLSAAQEFAIAETGDEQAVVNASRKLGLIAATTTERVYGKQPYVRVSGGLLLAKLLKKSPGSGAPRVVGFSLEGSGLSALILFVQSADGTLEDGCEVALNPSDPAFALEQFASSRRLPVDNLVSLLYDNAELVREAGNVEAYPAEASFLGMPETRAWWSLALVGGCVAAGTAFWAYQQWMSVGALEQQTAQAQKDKKSVEAQTKTLLASRTASLISGNAIDASAAVARAYELWVPGVTIKLQAKPAASEYSLTLPLRNQAQGSTLTLEKLMAVMQFSAPKGCSTADPSVTGTLDELQIRVVCENPSALGNRYRLD